MSAAAISIGTGLRWLEEARVRYGTEPGARVIFAHMGPLEHAALGKLLAVAESSSLSSCDTVAIRKRLVNVLMEGLENLHRHTHDGARPSVVALLVECAGGYRFAMGNALPNATAALLTHRIGILNEMDEADLREHYLKLFANDARSLNGGAGLGLLTMARKTERPMVVRTVAIDSALSYLGLELSISRG